MSFAELFSEEATLCRIDAEDRGECLRAMLRALVKSRRLTRRGSEKAREAIEQRERLGSTGIGGGVAIPHAKIDGLERVAVAVATHAEGLDFQSVDGELVKVVFLVVRPASEDVEHLGFLRWVASIGRNPDFRRFASAVETPAEMLSLLREMGGA